ncbi:putative E3 ubiquitin-protein ligase RING1a [Syzygium oleosum]|uniref:putative E3 ubiquitin-protein ligase RING1a n=1 Tax=Syzygium oleosum TaxID=219896 RepID=UPI0024BB22FA|nr:putative E3 ubiquitin-protein ligase RING1a [Syzygium oleosum]
MRTRKRPRKPSDGDVARRDGTTHHGEPPQDDHEFHRSSSSRDLDKDGYVQVELAEIREKLQCPICLGIIRNTRAVKECLHRFCQECIAKYMLLGGNECPACHEHCGSDALRADPRYDALIEAFYPDVVKSKEFAFHVIVAEDLTRNSSEKATNTDADHVASLHNTFVPAPIPLAEHSNNSSILTCICALRHCTY